MVLCLDPSGAMGVAMAGLSQNVTGSYFLSLLAIVLLLLVIALALRIPMEFTAILVMPMLLGALACDGDWMGIAGVAIIYLGILLGKNILFR